jgi:hypothetical protein
MRLFGVVSISVASACATTAAPPAREMLPPAPSAATVAPRVAVFRRFGTGLVSPRQTLTTYTMTWRQGRASLTIVDSELQQSGIAIGSSPPGWSDAASETLTGTAREDGASVSFDLKGPHTTLVLRCAETKVSVANATAVRTRSPGSMGGDCGDRGAWWPPTTTEVDALVCRDKATEPPEPAPVPMEEYEAENEALERVHTQLTFGELPGIEYLWVNDDCVIQGGGLRRILPDGGVHDARGPSDARP